MTRLTLPSKDPRGMMNRQNAAKFLGVSVRSIDRLRLDGTLRWKMILGRVVIYREDVERLAS